MADISIQLTKALNTRNTPAFKETLKKEIECLDAALLPLQQGLTRGDHANGDNFSVMINSVSEDADFIRAKVGIFYTSIIAGCNCADDPTPADEQAEYCEARFDINKKTAETSVTLLPELD